MVILDAKTFPIDERLPQIINELEDHSRLIIGAETGAGKTTRLPPYLAINRPGKVLVLEPRRLAAKLSAKRCAETLNSELGDIVGHHIRFDKKSSKNTKLLFITEGLFLPYLRNDPDLSEFDTVIIDEFHERNIHTDAALALCKRLQDGPRPDLKLIVMSATLDVDFLANYLESSKIVQVPGRTFPVEIEYREQKNQREFWDVFAARKVEEILEDPRNPLNTLVFLPGVGEIKGLEQKLQHLKDVDILPLYSSLPKSKQELVFKGNKRKIVLSTNIAETSLTIPNVTGVVDLGLERRASFAPWSGMPLLELKNISQASATQRAGRAGRTRPGIVYRIYSQANFLQREAFTPPEVKRVELSHYVLDLLELGLPIETLNWPEPIDERNMAAALELLETLGAIRNGKITELGKFLAKVPLHPRLGAMLYGENLCSDSLLGACILNEGGALLKQAVFSQEEDVRCDLKLQIDLLKDHLKSQERVFSDYHTSFLDKKKAARAKALYESLSKLLKVSSPFDFSNTEPERVTASLLAGFPDRVAKKRFVKKGKRSHVSYNFCQGRGGRITSSSVLSNTLPDYLIALEALEDPKANASIGTQIRMASEVKEERLIASNGRLLTQETETSFLEKKGLIKITKLTKYGKLILKEVELPPIEPKGEALTEIIKENWPWPFGNDEDIEVYHRRVRLLEESNIENACPIFEGDMFDLFVGTLAQDHSFEELKASNLTRLIEDQLSSQDLYVLNENAPFEVKLKNGKCFPVEYAEEGPKIQARLQDLFSINEHPLIGAKPLKLELLSPANRLAQVTMDLPQFWATTYAQVRKDLKARYPKHFWPERPEDSPPVRMKKDLSLS